MELTEDAIALLRGVLKQAGNERAIGAARYRVDHAAQMDLLNDLEEADFLQRDHGDDSYRVPLAALNAIGGPEAERLLKDIGLAYATLQDSYRASPRQTVTLKALAQQVELPQRRVALCVDYLVEACSMARSTDLYAEGATVTTSERLIAHGDFQAALAWWEGVVYPDLRTDTKPQKLHGNTVVNAEKRVQVLGAALGVMAAFPAQCKRGEKFNGKRIADQIDAKAALWWKETGEPPMSTDAIARLINNYLKILA